MMLQNERRHRQVLRKSGPRKSAHFVLALLLVELITIPQERVLKKKIVTNNKPMKQGRTQKSPASECLQVIPLNLLKGTYGLRMLITHSQILAHEAVG